MSKTKPVSTALIEAISPFPEQALPLLWHWIESFRDQVSDDYSPRTIEEFVELELARSASVYTWGIYRDYELGGYVRAVRASPVACEAHAIFKREFFGHATTVPALNDVARQLFAGGLERITMMPFASNHAIRSLIKALGGLEEGRLREYTRQHGQPVDVMVFGLLRSDWQAKQTPKQDGE